MRGIINPTNSNDHFNFLFRQLKLALVLIILFQFSCRQKTDVNSLSDAQQALNEKPQTQASHYLPPQTISLDTMQKPVSITSSVKYNPKSVPINDSSQIIRDNKSVVKNVNNHFVTYSTEHGLALSTVLCSVSDRVGNLWFGTQGGGVSKFDGKTFTTYSTKNGLANNTVLSITEDRRGNLWFGTDGGGACKFNGVFFKTFTTANGLAGNTIRAILEDKNGILWLAADDEGVSKYDWEKDRIGKNPFTTINFKMGLLSNKIRCMAEDNNGHIWFGTQEEGVCKYDGKTFVNYTIADGLAGNEIRSILKDTHNNLWFGTEHGGLSKFDTHTQSNEKNYFTNYSTPQLIHDNSIRSILEDRKGQIWFGSVMGGVSKLNELNGSVSFTTYTTNNGLAGNTVFSMTEDHSGNIWFGTYGGGVSEYCGDAFRNFSKAQGLSNSTVWGIEETNDHTLWFGTDGDGVCTMNTNSANENFKNINIEQGLAGNIILSVKKDKGGCIWFGSLQNGVSKFDGNGFTNYTTLQGLAHNMILCIKEDRDGNIWFGTGSGGISKFTKSADNKNYIITNYSTKQGLANDVIQCIAEDKEGHMWFGTQGGGISELKVDNIKSGESYFNNYTAEQGLANNNVAACFADKQNGNLYIGTESGLSILHTTNHTNGEVIIKNYSSLHGLPDNYITNIAQVPSGKIVLGTNNGVAIYNPELPLDKHGKLAELEIFNMSTGYPIKDVNGQGSMLLDSKGILWAGTGYDKIGLVRFDYNAVKRNAKPPKVLIEKIKLNEQDICWYSLSNTSKSKPQHTDSIIKAHQEILCYGNVLDKKEMNALRSKYAGIEFDSVTPFYPVPRHLILPYEHNQITIEFNGIEVSRHNMVNYQYKLEGYDKDWSPVLKKTEASFGNMSEGDYIFKLKAQSPDGIWSEPILYSFTVLPPWYRTWWAYLLYIVCSVTVMRLVFKWRTKELKKRQEQLKQTVKERTAELVSEKKEVEKQKEEAEKQYLRSEELLLNILPEEIAEELKLKGEVMAKQFHAVTVMFTDFVNFTGISQTLSPQSLVSEVHICYTEFDAIMERNGLEKIKTIGDAYLAVSGIPNSNEDHAANAVRAAIEIIAFIAKRKNEGGLFDIRIGLNSGPIVAGIVGVKKFAYDIWGDTVNTAARMEQNSLPGKVNISGATYELVKNEFTFINRGKIQAKNKGEINMYFVS